MHFVFLSFLGSALALQGAGFMASPLAVFGAAALLILAVIAQRSDAEMPARTRVAGWSLAAGGLLSLPVPLELRGFALAAWFAGLAMVGASPAVRDSARRLAAGGVVAGLSLFAYHRSAAGWHAFRGLANAASSLVTGLGGVGVDVGPTFSGLFVLVFAVTAMLATVDGRRRSTGVAVFVALFVVLLKARVVVAWPYLADGREAHVLTFLPAASAVVFAIAAAFLLRGNTRPAGHARSSKLAVAATGGAMAVVLAIPFVVAISEDRPRRVAFYREGYHNWDAPRPGDLDAAAGMYGRLPGFVRDMGWEAEIIDELDEPALDGVDVLFVGNQHERMAEEQRRVVREFVADGGGLLVAGDHTAEGGDGELWINGALEGTDIAFAFDSADHLVPVWSHSLALTDHPVVRGLDARHNFAGSAIGASLDIEWPAMPLSIGRFGYRDRGVDVARDDEWGHLGNLNPDADEDIGDVVLAAAQEVGEGRVVVLGDTTALFNATHAWTWPFLSRAFGWLGSRDGGSGHRVADLLRCCLLLVVLAGTVMLARRRAAPALGGLALAIAVGGAAVERIAPDAVESRSRADVLIDISHLQQFSHWGSRDAGCGALALNLLRAGRTPAITTGFESEMLRSAAVFVTIAPARPYTKDEVDELEAFMNGGGTVLAAAGHDDADGLAPLLARHGVTILPRPLGGMAAFSRDGSWRFEPVESWEVSGGTPLASASGHAVACEVEVGAGRLVVVGDTRFLLDANLETKEDVNRRNIEAALRLCGITTETTP